MRSACRNGRHLSGFSMVEVALALGVSTFVIVTLIALLPIGLQVAQESYEETQMTSILRVICADRQATDPASPSNRFNIPAFPLPAGSSQPFLYEFWMGRNMEVLGSAAAPGAAYRVQCTILMRESWESAQYIHYRILWPPQAGTLPAGSMEILSAYPLP